jgi:hypothetical protein
MALDFTTGTLDPRVTVTRALNTATAVNSSGFISVVNANLPRFDYDPATLAPKGLLIEESRTNLLPYSNDLSNGVWSRTNITRTVSGVNSPDGTANANSVAATANGTAIFNTSAYAITGTAATFSIYVRQGTGATTSNYYGMRNQTTATTLVLGRLNFSTGVWTYINGSTGVTVRNAGNGWWRLEIAVSSGITSGNSVFAYVGYAGQAVTAGEYSDAYGAQLEAGAFATSYIPTTTTSLTRNADVVSMTGTNFSDWYNASEGTFSIRADLLDAGSLAKNPFGQVYGTATTTLFMGKRIAGGSAIDFQFFVRDTTTQAFITPLSALLTSNTFFTGVSAYKANSFQAACNAIAGTPDISGTVPTGLTAFNIGSSGTETAYLNGHVSQVSYWPQRITNAEAQAFSKR